jgi:hypothetical protein
VKSELLLKLAESVHGFWSMQTIWLIKISYPLALFEQVGFGYASFNQFGPTSHAADASPRSISTLFLALSVFPFRRLVRVASAANVCRWLAKDKV